VAKDKLEVKVQLDIDEAKKKLKQLKGELKEAEKTAGGVSTGGSGGRPGRAARTLRARRSVGGGGRFGALRGAVGKAAGVAAVIYVILKVVQGIAVGVDAIGQAIERFGFSSIGKKIQSLVAGFNELQAKVVSQTARLQAVTQVGGAFASAGLSLSGSGLKKVSDRFAEDASRSFQESQRRASRNVVNYGKLIKDLTFGG
jgi:hypothetical protein